MSLKFITTALLAILPASALAADPVPVTVQRLGDLLIDKELRAPATVISANRALVTSEVSALIVDVPVDVGDTIREGETLVVLDDNNNRLMLAQAKARLVALKAQIAQARSAGSSQGPIAASALIRSSIPIWKLGSSRPS